MKENPGTYAFHNLNFDGAFIIDYLLKHGFTLNKTDKRPKTKQFSTLISRMGKFYSMEICFNTSTKKTKASRSKIIDSFKLYPMGLDKLAKTMKMEVSKLTIDYNKPREVGYIPNRHERKYQANDVHILCEALKQWEQKGYNRITIGSQTLAAFKEHISQLNFEDYFPIVSLKRNENFRAAYRGGYVYCNPKFQGKLVTSGCVYDVNSLYPYVLQSKLLPYGLPIVQKGGEARRNDTYPLSIQNITLNLKLKKNHLPCLQAKNTVGFLNTEYISDTNGDMGFWLTNVDYETVKQNYDFVDEPIYHKAYLFKARADIFSGFITFFRNMKENAETEGERLIAKLFLNSLYGKFGTHPDITPKHPILKDDGHVALEIGESETRDPVYTPVAAFTTAYARQLIISAALENFDRFLYCDTDSLHLLGTHPPNIDIHPNRFGAFKHEDNFTRAKFLHAKCYCEEIDGGIKPTIAGLTKGLRKYVNFDNFERGLYLHVTPPDKREAKHYKHIIIVPREDAKLAQHRVPGGIVLEPTRFSIH
jgi:hypothetical protein